MGAVRRWPLSRVVAALAVLVVVAGCGLGGGGDDDRSAARPATETGVSSSPEVADEVLPLEPETPEPDPEPTTKRPKPVKPTPAEDRNNFQLPECAHHEGRKVTKKQAKAALSTAAGRTYWPQQAPELKLSADLVKSIAWHESGWQADIVNCDGGRGLMQVMPDTVEMINTRFTKSYAVTDYRQNAVLGANYLAWLTKYFGEKFFQDRYDLSPARCKSHSDMCLLNMVISAYNSGFGTVEAARRAKAKRLPNPAYVDSVRSLMKSCFCDRY